MNKGGKKPKEEKKRSLIFFPAEEEAQELRKFIIESFGEDHFQEARRVIEIFDCPSLERLAWRSYLSRGYVINSLNTVLRKEEGHDIRKDVMGAVLELLGGKGMEGGNDISIVPGSVLGRNGKLTN